MTIISLVDNVRSGVFWGLVRVCGFLWGDRSIVEVVEEALAEIDYQDNFLI